MEMEPNNRPVADDCRSLVSPEDMKEFFPEDMPDEYTNFLGANNIRHDKIFMRGTKKEAIPIHTMRTIFSIISNPSNHPVLIHCNHGRHRTGCAVAIFRKITGWSLGEILSEYKHFADPKARDCDLQYISKFQPLEMHHAMANPPPAYLSRGTQSDSFAARGTQSASFARKRNFLKFLFLSALLVIMIWQFSVRNGSTFI